MSDTKRPVRRLTPAEQRALKKGDLVLWIRNDGSREESVFLWPSDVRKGYCSITPLSGSGTLNIVPLDSLGTSESRFGEETISVG